MLELMIVIVLIGMLAGMVSLASGPSPARQARQQAEDFIRVVQQLRERAVLDAREYGLRLQSRAYQAVRLEARGWTAVTSLHWLPENLTLGLEQDGQILPLDDVRDTPQLLMLSSDEISPFRLFIKVTGQTLLQVSSDGVAEPFVHE